MPTTVIGSFRWLPLTSSKHDGGRGEACGRGLVHGVHQRRRQLQEARDHLHLTLARAQSALRETLARGHAADVVVEREARREQRQGAGVRVVQRRLVDGDVERAAVLLIPGYLHVLQEAHKADLAPSQAPTVWLHQDQLKDVNHQEAPLSLAAMV